MLQAKIFLGVLCLLPQTLSFALPARISDLINKRGIITDDKTMTSQILRGDQSCGGGDKGPYGLVQFTLWCANNKDKCRAYSSPDSDFSKRDLDDVSSTSSGANVTSSLSDDETNDLVKRVQWNFVPMWVLCAGPQGQAPAMYTKAQIVAAIEEGVNLWARRQQSRPTRNGYTYPKQYHPDANTPDLGHANRKYILEFPILTEGPPYGQQYPGPYPQPGADRVLFDNCAQFAALMTHNTLDDNNLRSCWEVDASGRPINTPGVPGSNPNPPPIVGEQGVGGLPLGQVPRQWLGLGPGDPYPNPGTKFP